MDCAAVKRDVSPAVAAIFDMTIKLAAVLLAAAVLAGCGADRPGPDSEGSAATGETPVSSHAQDREAINPHDWFIDRAKEAGLQFVHINGMSGEFYFPEMIPPGVGLFDYELLRCRLKHLEALAIVTFGRDDRGVAQQLDKG